VNRRRLLIGAALVAGGGLALTWLRPDPDKRRLTSDAAALEPNAYLQITPAGEIILQVDKAELGQGVITGFVTCVAEELDVPPARIVARFAPVHPLFQDPTMVTGESKSTLMRWQILRETGAAAHDMLLRAAAARWGVARDAVRSDGEGHVVNAAGDRLAYAELAAQAAQLPVPDKVQLRAREAFRYIGGVVARPDIPAKVRGAAQYGIDVQMPGLMTAVVVRSREFGGSIARVDDTIARAAPGVQGVYAISTGIAVVAETFWHARRAAETLAVEWQGGPLATTGTASVHAEQRRRLDSEPGDRVRDDGEADAAFADAGDVVEAEYTFPYLAHATMEPMNCTVALSSDAAEIWVPSQGPDMARQIVCNMTGLAREQVTVHSTFCGGGFGRRALLDYVVEATAIAQQAGVPVKLVFSREDDMRHGFYRQATVHRTRAAIDASGQPVAWSHRLVAGSLSNQILPLALPAFVPEWWPRPMVGSLSRGASRFATWALGPFQARGGAVTMPYAIPNVAVDTLEWNPGIPIGIWRSVGNSYNAFVVESFIDELAARAAEDPAAFRRELLKDKPRHLAVLDKVIAASGWGRTSAGRHHGLAVHEAFGTVVAQVAEVSVSAEQGIRVHRVTCAVDCGFAINADIVRQQMEGAIIFGLTAALYGEISIENGRVLQSNFHDYPMLRLHDAPEIEVHIVETGAELSGVGEPGTPPIAPAVANAVFAATGRRLRDLPLRLS
jgi:CO/xanthine dehydrogenase Mo-binding subunit